MNLNLGVLCLLFVGVLSETTRIQLRVFGSDSGPSSCSLVASILAKNIPVGFTVLNATATGNYSNYCSLSSSSSGSAGSSGTSSSSTGTTGSLASSGNKIPALSNFILLFVFFANCFGGLSLLDGRNKKFIAIFMAAILVHSHTVSALSQQYNNCKVMDLASNYKLHWTVSGSNIRMAMEADVTGWIATGLSTDGSMTSASTGSDYQVGWFAGNTPVYSNRHTNLNDPYSVPVVDSADASTVTTVALTGNHLSVEFTRPLAATTASEDRAITPGTAQNVLWSVRAAGVPSPIMERHSSRGSVLLDFGLPSVCPTRADDFLVTIDLDTPLAAFSASAFLTALSNSLNAANSRFSVENSQAISPPFCPDCAVVDYKINNYPVQAATTSYVCGNIDFGTTKRQIIRFDGLPDNNNVIHHMIIATVVPGFPVPTPDPNPSCFSQPSGTSPFGGWAPGATSITMPPGVAMTVGGTGATESRYGVIQYHYDNPASRTDYVDSSGFRAWTITDPTKFRSIEAGFVLPGRSTRDIAIPPLKQYWHEQADCTVASTINVFGISHHMHTYGRQMWAEIYRAGNFLAEIGLEKSFDFKSQKFIEDNFTLVPGDLFRVHCVWNTLNSTTVVRGGEQTINEMCLLPLMYFPKGNLGNCVPSGVGCECSHDGIPNFCNSSACTSGNTTTTSCSAVKNCTACKATSGCGWCSTSVVTGCFDSSLSSKCGVSWNNCTAPGTTCGPDYSTCSTCNAAAAPQCAWCVAGTFGSDSLCIAKLPGNFTTQGCNALRGVVSTTCSL